MTRQKQLIFNLVKSHHDHPTADQIYLEVRTLDAHISRGTVYRNLEQLSDAGNILRIKVPGPDRFDSRLEYHYHMVCKSCGAVFDVPLDYQSQIDQEVRGNTGFQIDRHRMVFEGRCASCRSMTSGEMARLIITAHTGAKHP